MATTGTCAARRSSFVAFYFGLLAVDAAASGSSFGMRRIHRQRVEFDNIHDCQERQTWVPRGRTRPSSAGDIAGRAIVCGRGARPRAVRGCRKPTAGPLLSARSRLVVSTAAPQESPREQLGEIGHAEYDRCNEIDRLEFRSWGRFGCLSDSPYDRPEPRAPARIDVTHQRMISDTTDEVSKRMKNIPEEEESWNLPVLSHASAGGVVYFCHAPEVNRYIRSRDIHMYTVCG